MPPSLGIYRDLSYIHPFNQHRTFDLFIPAPARYPPIPLVIFIHGGAWRAGDKEEYASQAKFWASNKRYPMAVAVINYRLSSMDETGGPVKYPDHISDCAEAVKWFRYPGRSQHYGYDPDRIFLVGHSTGAEITGVLVLDPRWLGDGYRAIRGVVSVQGVYDLPRLAESLPAYAPYIEDAFGKQEEEEKRNWVFGSPQYLLLAQNYRLPPQLILHSEEDDVLSGDQASRYVEHLRGIVGKEGGGVGLPPPDPERRVQMITQLAGKHYEVLLTPEFTALVLSFVESIFPDSRGSSATLSPGSRSSPVSISSSSQISPSASSSSLSTSGRRSAPISSYGSMPNLRTLQLQSTLPSPSPQSQLNQSFGTVAVAAMEQQESALSRGLSSGSLGNKEKKTLASFFGIGKHKSLKK